MKPKKIVITDHDIDPYQIDADAIYVLKKLHEKGFEAYLVGGSVRDLLVKREPKDCDISTSARPEEIKAIFRRNCILIGRRFRLAHIRFGHKILEVSTFRSGDNDSDLIIRDNTWGSEEEDVLRRDFTINGLFYDPSNHTVIDYIGGLDDIHKKILKTIGDPNIRFKQDPVRMIRLLKFKARFDFAIEKETENALTDCRNEIIKSSPARIMEEIFRMLESGSSKPFFQLMTESGLLGKIFPDLTVFLKTEGGNKIFEYLNIVDQMNISRVKRPLQRSILAACLLYPILEKKLDNSMLFGDVMITTSDLIKKYITSSFSHFPRRINISMNNIMCMQYRFDQIFNKKLNKYRILRQKEFPAALKFLKIRSLVDDAKMQTYNAWSRLWQHYKKQTDHPKHHHPPPRIKGHER